jgi:hypothetical protein
MELDACFVVIDDDGQKLASVYFEDEPGRRIGGEGCSRTSADAKNRD